MVVVSYSCPPGGQTAITWRKARGEEMERVAAWSVMIKPLSDAHFVTRLKISFGGAEAHPVGENGKKHFAAATLFPNFKNIRLRSGDFPFIFLRRSLPFISVERV